MANVAIRVPQILALIALAGGCQAAPVAVPPPPPPPADPVLEVGVDVVPIPPKEEMSKGEKEGDELAEDFDKDRAQTTTGPERPKKDKDPESTVPEGQNAPPPIQAATTEKTGPRVDAAQIQQAVAQRRDLFSRCLHVDTSIEIDATISPSGRVLQVKSERSVPNEPKLRDCIVDAFRKLSLEPFGSDAPAHVKFALALKRR